jgi:hypothetical protein
MSKSIVEAVYRTVAVGALLALPTQQAQVPEFIARMVVDGSLTTVAETRSPADFARALAADGIPAGFVISKDDRRIGSSQPVVRTGQAVALGRVLQSLENRRSDLNVGERAGALLVARRESVCMAPLDRTLRNVAIENKTVVEALSVIHKHLDPTAPSGRPGLAGSTAGAGVRFNRGVPPLPTTARVSLVSSEITVGDALQQIAVQAPGVVWAVFETESSDARPRCMVDLYFADGSLVTGVDILR